MRSSVGVDHGSGLGTAPPPGHLKRVDDDLRGDAIADRPADDTARVGVDHGGAVDPSVSRAVLRDVTEPEPVRRVCAELPLHEVLVGRGVGLPAASLATMRYSDQPVQPHQPCDAFPGNVDAESEPQLGEHPRRPIRLPRVGMNAPDRGRQLAVGDGPRRRWPVSPVVVAGGRDVQEPAGHRDGDTVSGELADQPEPYFGRTFSRAK